MLIDCPECGRRVSDRAVVCPDCAFPIAEEIRAARAREEAELERTSRVEDGEVDCAACEARGFRLFERVDEAGARRQEFAWCRACEHSGRVALFRSAAGYFAVAWARVEAFRAGEMGHDDEGVLALGERRPEGHRYPAKGPRKRG